MAVELHIYRFFRVTCTIHATEVKIPIRFSVGNTRFLAFFAISCTHETVLVSVHYNRMRSNFCSIRAVRSKKIEEVFRTGCHTDKKEENNFIMNKEIQMGAVAKSYITNGLLIYDYKFAHFLMY